MSNQKAMAIALVALGLCAVNFFYLSDIVLDETNSAVIVLGWKSGIAIAIANLVVIGGLIILALSRDSRPTDSQQS